MATKIEKTAIIEKGAIIGQDCYIGHFTVIRPGAIIGDRSHVRAHCFIAADALIGHDTQVMQLSNICRNSVVGDECFIGMGCILTNTKNIAYRRSYDDECNAPIIKRACRIGAGVTILPGVVIGTNCVIGAGSVVTKSTSERYVYVGNPAKMLRAVTSVELI